MLSFLTSRYWTQRVGYLMSTHEVQNVQRFMINVDCLYHAGQVLIGGPENLLLVILDMKVHPGERVRFALGGDRGVDVLGRAARAVPAADPMVREAVVDAWLGGQMTQRTPPPRSPAGCLRSLVDVEHPSGHSGRTRRGPERSDRAVAWLSSWSNCGQHWPGEPRTIVLWSGHGNGKAAWEWRTPNQNVQLGPP